MLVKIHEDSNLSQLLVNIKSNYSFKAIAIRITGTNGVTPVTLDDIGRVVYMKKGITLIDCAFEYFTAIDDLIAGTPDITSTASGALDFYIIIPRRYGDKNVEHVSASDNAQISINFKSTLASRVASGGKVEVYLDCEDGIQKYDLMFKQYSKSVAGESIPHVAIEQDNIIAVYLTEYISNVLTLASTNLTAVQGNLGHMNINASMGALIDDTTLKYNIEQTPDDIKAVNIFKAEGDITSGLIDGLTFNITCGAASTFELCIVSMSFDPSKIDKSIMAQQTRINTQLQSKMSRGKVNDVAAIRKIATRVG